jgi:hypothetical protein
MRALLALSLLAACSVPDKNPTGEGPDAMLPVDDDAVPDTTIVEAPAEFAASGTAMFRFTADHANAHFECSIDGENPVPCTSPYTRVIGDGSHSFQVRALNKNNMGDPSPAEHLWTIDTVAPNTMLTEVPPPVDNSVMVRFGFSSSEENVTFDCALDGDSYVACESGADFGPMADGSHSFAVRAHDRAGNVDSSPAIHAWSIDTATPDTQILSGPSGAVSANSATFTFISPDAGSGAAFQCSLDGNPMVDCASPYTLNNLSMGMHTFQVRVRDAVGNLDPTPATRTWTVDLDAPDAMITSGPMGMMNAASATFTFTSNETGVTYSCSLDGAPFTGCTSPAGYSNLAQGMHSFAVRATDAAMHTDASPATRAWTVDTEPPDTTITSGPTGNTMATDASFAFTASEANATFECSLDSAAFAACTSPATYSGLAVGAHSFAVRAIDAAMHTDASPAMASWTIDAMPPPP